MKCRICNQDLPISRLLDGTCKECPNSENKVKEVERTKIKKREKRKQELYRGPKIPMKIDFFSIIIWAVILITAFWFASGDLDDPKSDCEKYFEYHKDYQVLDQCRKNTLLKDIYDN